MRHQNKISSEEHNRWLKLETTIGNNVVLIEKDEVALGTFLRSFDNVQKREFKELTGIDITETYTFEIKDKIRLRLLLLKKFISGIGLEIIQEARPNSGNTEQDIYLTLLTDLVNEDKLPEDIFCYAIYRLRGTPTSWMSIKSEIGGSEARQKLVDNLQTILNSVNWRMGTSRKVVMVSDVNDLTLALMTKPIAAKVVRAENKNVEVSSASYTIIVLDKANKRIGIVSGSKKEISAIYSVLRNKVYKDGLAPTRNDKNINGPEILKKLIANNPEDNLRLQTLELKQSSLSQNPSIKLQVRGESSLDAAIESIPNLIGENVSIADLKQAEFQFIGGKKVTIYTFGDDWLRLCINTATKRITSVLETAFLQQVKDRLEGINIKTTRLLLDDLTIPWIVEKFLKDKRIDVNPPIPEKAEKVLVKLVRLKLISRQRLTTRRICWNCYGISWDQWQCPFCSRSDMRILGEQMIIEVQQSAVIRNLKSSSFGNEYLKSYSTRQRRNYSKPILELHNKAKGITSYVVFAESKRDIPFIRDLSSEGIGVVAIVDPKLWAQKDGIENVGASVVELKDVIVKLLDSSEQLQLKAALLDQEQQVLERVHDNARSSLNTLKAKGTGYNERDFERDVKNIFQALVPDVFWLGAKYSGKSVPDGYLVYGTQAKRLMGWDAKYSETGLYRLNANDARKQKKYIDWLIDPDQPPSKLAKLGLYAIISNFDEPKRMERAVNQIAQYRGLPSYARVSIIEDKLLILVAEWMLDNWRLVIKNNSAIANELFKWLRRKQAKDYTLSSSKNWESLKAKLDKLIET